MRGSPTECRPSPQAAVEASYEGGKSEKFRNDGCRRLFTLPVAVLYFSFFIFHFSFASPQSPDSLTIYYTDGVRLSASGEASAALEKFEHALKIEPDHDPSLFEAANILSAAGDLPEALEYSSRAAALDPENRWYRGQKARLLVYLERFDEALPLFESMVGDASGFDPDNYRMLSLLYYQLGRTDDALSALDEAEVRMGPNGDITELKRSILIDAGRIEEAVAVTEKYVSQTPYDEDNRLVLAEMYSYEGRDSLQMETLKEVVAINPDNAGALIDLADLYLRKGQAGLYFATVKQLFLLDGVEVEDKIEHFEKLTRSPAFYRNNYRDINDLALVLVTHYPANSRVVELYADHAVRSGDAEGALAMLKTRLKEPEPALSTFLKTIEIEAWLKRPDSVALYSDRALTLYPAEQRIYMLRSGALQFMGRMKEARKTLDRALKVATADSVRSEIYGARGTLWHEEGKDKKAFADYEKALIYNPGNALVLNNYAYYLAVEGRELDRALGMASRAVKIQENFATYLDTYAWVLYKQGDYAGAKKVMQQALPLDRDGSAELLIHYGDILWALGDEFMASTYWKRAREAGYEPAAEIEERLSRIK